MNWPILGEKVICVKQGKCGPVWTASEYEVTAIEHPGRSRVMLHGLAEHGYFPWEWFRPSHHTHAPYAPRLAAAIEEAQEVAREAVDANPKTRYGQAKPQLGLVPGTALAQIAEAFRNGTTKYGEANWRDEPVSMSTYFHASLRHIHQWYDGENNDPESGAPHLAHAAANMCILLDALAQGCITDDRPTPGQTSRLIKDLTRAL